MLRQSDPHAAEQYYLQAIKGIEALPTQARQSAVTMRVLSALQGNLGDLYSSNGNPAEGIRRLQISVSLGRQRVARDPLDDRARYDLHTTQQKLGEAYMANGDKIDARASFNEVLRSIAIMQRKDPGNAALKEHAYETRKQLADLGKR